ncbi:MULTISPECIES: 2OG-Fe(II) oxygenase [Microbulbifer]|uniref:2OG-Fe(II) oxygenase n=1 Tax=Microbulbifer TaxID=48073 RepID=UPI001E58D071|nr:MULTISPECIES: 2OG-Fe(II) oxygenase [Microbulbifer]UHQ56016.1 2OG-Fe(II) oxygenase [Microbulbifer sp. YPW16]
MTAVIEECAEWLTPASLNNAEPLVRSEPFHFLVARNLLPTGMMDSVSAHFPKLKGAGYLPYEAEQCGDSVNALVARLVDHEFANALGDRLGIDNLAQYPTYVSISRTLKKRHGKIHTDGKSKVATALLYLNQDWKGRRDGCLRFLNRIDDFDDTVIPEIPPVYGTLAAFKRADNSFHGHLPFQGERHVIQVAWLVNADEKLRKAKRGRLSHKLKRLQAWLGKKLGGRNPG